MCCGQNFACSGRYCVCRSKTWHLRRQKFACLKVVLLFFEKFSKFFWIFNGKNTLLLVVSVEFMMSLKLEFAMEAQ